MVWQAAIPMIMQMMQQNKGNQSGQQGTSSGWGNFMGSGMPTGAGIGSFLGGLFSKWRNPQDASDRYLNQVEGKARGIMDPYVSTGQRMLPQLESQYTNLVNNPNALQDRLASEWKESPAYTSDIRAATKGANAASAAGGNLGSLAEQSSLAKDLSGITDSYRNQYVNTGLNTYGKGLQGMQGLEDQGFQGSQAELMAIIQELMAQAEAAWAGQDAENRNTAGKNAGLGGLVGGLLGGF